jgi:hypothetical protein
MFVPRVGGILVELSLGGEDDDGDLGVAEDGDLVRLLEEAIAPLGEGHLPVYLVLYPLQLHLPATHRRLLLALRSATKLAAAGEMDRSPVR